MRLLRWLNLNLLQGKQNKMSLIKSMNPDSMPKMSIIVRQHHEWYAFMANINAIRVGNTQQTTQIWTWRQFFFLFNFMTVWIEHWPIYESCRKLFCCCSKSMTSIEFIRYVQSHLMHCICDHCKQCINHALIQIHIVCIWAEDHGCCGIWCWIAGQW